MAVLVICVDPQSVLKQHAIWVSYCIAFYVLLNALWVIL